MKHKGILTLLAAFLLFDLNGYAQTEADKLDLPGDNLNLYAVLKIFQESETLELFEKKLNEEESEINNLDLDGDNNIDYIKVIDNVDGNVHNIVLQIAVSETENQDVAVIVVEKKPDGEVEIQVIGDEELYGKDYIVEPNFDGAPGQTSSTPNPGYKGNSTVYTEPVVVEKTTTYQIATWPVVQFIYVPSYVIWRSPWSWHYYPSYWRPWRPQFWHYYYGYHYHWNYYYYGHYRRWNTYRYSGWNNFYYSNRRSRSNVVIVRRQRGDYRNTYSRPELARNGSDLFRKNYPKTPSANIQLPPSITRPAKPSPEKPVTTRPVTRPGITPERPGTRPVTRPTPTHPVTRPTPTNPSTRPVTPPRPITRPAPTNPPVNRPSPRPGGSGTQPTKPAVKPAPAPRPATRPAVRPAPTKN